MICLLGLTVNIVQAQVCTTVNAGDWATAATWSCVGATAPPSGTFSGTLIITKNVTVSSNITITGQVSAFIRNNAVLNVTGSNTLKLSSNNSFIEVQTGSTVSGQQANSQIVIGTSPVYTYVMNGGTNNTINGPTRLTNNGPALPVTLLYFNATAEGTRVSLAWATADEQNAKQFVVERSPNLDEFTSVGTVAAVGTTQVRQNYGLIDNQPLMGTSYYRLRQLDNNGSAHYSKVVAVRVTDSAPGLLVLGNPVQSGVIRLLAQKLDGATYQLTSLLGQFIDIQLVTQQDGEVTLIPAHSLPNGLYLLSAQSGAVRLVRKLLID